jgi:endoglucanase
MTALRAFAAAAVVLAGLVPSASRAVDVPPAYKGILSSVSSGTASRAVRLDRHILVDQFGYRPNDPKVAVIRDPRQGFDANDRFSPEDAYEVRRAEDSTVAFTGQPVPWKGGEVESSSGDRGWWLDFSKVSAPGTYFIFDPSNKRRSPTFSIDQRVYADVLKAAVRMYFYQRSGMAKSPPYADSCWRDAPAYTGPNQDTQAHDITDPNNRAKVKDLSGGWFDAGDTNKYVTNAIRPVHQLLTAYQENPAVFTDDFNIPESGNGIPDLLDEVRWETGWLKKMQYPDGSAALKVGSTVYVKASPPSSDAEARFYVPSCSSSTIAVAGMFAHAAYVYRGIPALAGEANDLQLRAVKAWDNYQHVEPKQTQCDSGLVKVGGADLKAENQGQQAVVAAIYLLATEGGPAYADYIKAHYKELRPYRDLGWARYDPEQGEALLFYTTLPAADARLAQSILADLKADAHAGNGVYGLSQDDLYRNLLHPGQYHWGSNEVRANYGNTNMEAALHGADDRDAASYRGRGLDTLHYFHGVNPFAKVYLSNMYRYGATSSVNEIFHAWFRADCNRLMCTSTRWSNAIDSECGPAPGYLPGGPVSDPAAGEVPATLAPPSGQPAQKGYRESSSDEHKSWVFNEPSIVYQAAYVQLLARFAN